MPIIHNQKGKGTLYLIGKITLKEKQCKLSYLRKQQKAYICIVLLKTKVNQVYIYKQGKDYRLYNYKHTCTI